MSTQAPVTQKPGITGNIPEVGTYHSLKVLTPVTDTLVKSKTSITRITSCPNYLELTKFYMLSVMLGYS